MSQHKPANQQQVKSAHAQGLAPHSHPTLPHLPTPTTQVGLSHATVQRALANPRALAPADILQLQRTAGNQAVQRLLQQESQAGFEADSDFKRQLNGTKGSGSLLLQKTKHEFEQSLGTNFDNVRIHTNAASNQLNRSIQAKAFTHGNDIHFDAGEFNPTTAQGKHLLAHELTHTIQQTGGKPSQTVQTKLQVGPAKDRYEQEADQVAKSASAHRAKSLGQPRPVGGPRIQRKLQFKSGDLLGNVSQKAILKGKLGRESSFSEMQGLLAHYWQIPRNDLQQQLSVLQAMDKLCANWLRHHEKSANKQKGFKDVKYTSVAKLSSAVSAEISRVQEKSKSREFLAKYGGKFGQRELTANLVDDVSDEIFALGKQLYSNQKHKTSHPGDTQDLIHVSDGKGGTLDKRLRGDPAEEMAARDKYVAQKHLKLTEAHRGVLHGYTGGQYYLMNPAMAGDEAWMKSQMSKAKNKANYFEKNMDKPGFVQQVMQQNQEMGEMLQVALNKLPNWKQDRTLYRGETLTEDEAMNMKKGFVKHFKHFVSTSLNKGIPDVRIQEFKENKRWSITYQITDSSTGKDIREFGKNYHEEEILFAPGTRFQVTEVLDFDVTKKHLEVKVVQV